MLARGAAVVDDEDAAAPAAVCRVGTHCDDDGKGFFGVECVSSYDV